MDDSEATSLEQIRAFLDASCGTVRFAGRCRKEVYAWTERTLVQHLYTSLKRLEKGLVRRYVAGMTGLSRAQVARLIGRYTAHGRVAVTTYQRRQFATRYTKADVELLAYVDQSHGNLSGPATKHILQREYAEYGQAAFKRLAQISVAQIYRFRNSAAYRKRNTSYHPTRPTPIRIGQRRKPRPQLLIEQTKSRAHSVAVALMNGVDPQIPGLTLLLEQFPFGIRGFHSDNGSEFINHTASEAEAMNEFHRQQLNPYLNFHRPCAIAEVIEEPNGKRRRVYRRWATPFEIFRETPQCEQYLRAGIRMEELLQFAQGHTDTEAAIEMQRAKKKLLAGIAKRSV